MTPDEIDWHNKHRLRNYLIVGAILACPVCCTCLAIAARVLGLV